MPHRKKLIEVALPLEAINKESAREKNIRQGHPSTLHLWWARRPLAACRAVLFASLVDDPSEHPERFPTDAEQARERNRLFRLIEELVRWENTNNEALLDTARREILHSTGHNPPAILDPFCGGGSIPLEAQRLGLEAHASDLNPVPVLITKALIQIPPRFADLPPVNPVARAGVGGEGSWRGAAGLAEDVNYYGRWMRDEAEAAIGHLYPKAKLPSTFGRGESSVVAWLWARTVECPNPACRLVMPLLNSFTIVNRRKRKFHLRPIIAAETAMVRFRVCEGASHEEGGTVSRTGAVCIRCRQTVRLDYIRSEARAGRMGAQLLCVVAEGSAGKTYLEADSVHEAAANIAKPQGILTSELPEEALGFRVQAYGLTTHADLFSARQLTALEVFAQLVAKARDKVLADGGSAEYADAVATYLGLCVSRLANRCSSQSFFDPGGETVQQVFARNALPMIWVYAEANPFSDSSGNFVGQVEYLAAALARTPARGSGHVQQADATNPPARRPMMTVTDPPYYDNVPYADLSDFFYVWLRRALSTVHPDLFSTLLVPKSAELIAEPARHGGRAGAATFFEDGLRRFFSITVAQQAADFPFVVFYAFKQVENEAEGGIASTGWETMLQGLLDAGASVTATWPVRTEQGGGLREVGRNALASSIVLVCRPRPSDAPIGTRRQFLTELRQELPIALRNLQHGNIAPVDLAQAAIGPGMSIFSKYAKVLESDGSAMRVRTALAVINEILGEVLAEQEGEFDADTRFAISWFDQYGMEEGPFGQADVLARAKNTSVSGMEQAGILVARGNKVRLLSRDDLDSSWDPATDDRLTAWEATQHLIRVLTTAGEPAAASLLKRLGGMGETVRDLAYRLYTTCERKKWAQEAVAYNTLVASWSEIVRLAQEASSSAGPTQIELV